MYFLNKIAKPVLIIFFIISLCSACEKWIDPELNIDPDQVSEVKSELLLSSIELNMAYVLGGKDAAINTSYWVQYSYETARSAVLIGRYNIISKDTDRLWKSLYEGGMMDTKHLMDNSDDALEYRGITNILMALYLGNTTDLFGDIPYSEAFQGIANLNPHYDSQELIYQNIQLLLTQGIEDLANTKNTARGDFMYNGNKEAWIKAAYSLKARYALHLSLRNPDYATEVLSYISKGMSSNNDDLKFDFGLDTNENNPIYQFQDQRGDAANAQYFLNLLTDDSDPREIIFESTGGYNFAGIYYGKKNSPVELMTYTELMFIAAEASLALDNEAQAKTYMKLGISSSINKYMGIDSTYDADAPSWLIAKEAEMDAIVTLTLEDIHMQKYVAQYLKPETYVDYRRTGFPPLIPHIIAGVPHRFPYPKTEYDYNSNTPASHKYQKVWWDND